MPYIKRKEVKPKEIHYKRDNKSTDFYNSVAWKRLRDTFLKEHPICKICLEHNRVSPTTQIHHAIPFLRGHSIEEQWNLFLDEKNLIPVCDKCHTALHVKDNMYHLGRLDNLTDKEYNYAHCII